MAASKKTTVRFPEQADDALDAVAAELGLDRSNTLRFLVMEKARALGLVPAPRPRDGETLAAAGTTGQNGRRGRRASSGER